MPGYDPYFLHVQTRIAELERSAQRRPARPAAPIGALMKLSRIIRRPSRSPRASTPSPLA